MTIVVDASVMAANIFEDESSAYADASIEHVVRHGGIIPSLFWYEIRNLLLVAERRGRLAGAKAEHFIREARTLDLSVPAPLGDDRVLRTSRNHDLTAYDAAYAALAIREDRPLATFDKALVRAGEAGAFASWRPTSVPPT